MADESSGRQGWWMEMADLWSAFPGVASQGIVPRKAHRRATRTFTTIRRSSLHFLFTGSFFVHADVSVKKLRRKWLRVSRFGLQLSGYTVCCVRSENRLCHKFWCRRRGHGLPHALSECACLVDSGWRHVPLGAIRPCAGPLHFLGTGSRSGSYGCSGGRSEERRAKVRMVCVFTQSHGTAYGLYPGFHFV